MSVPAPGLVRLEGLLEGPTASWSPAQDRLQDALRRAGAPADLLRAVVEGGRAFIEPLPGFVPRRQFAAVPAEVVGLALELLLEEGPGGTPRDWFSTLRVVEYQQQSRRESLLSLTPDGVRAVTRETPWKPPAAPPEWRSWLRHWPTVLLLVVAAAAVAVLRREQIGDLWRGLWGAGAVAPAGAYDAGAARFDAGGFAPWIALEHVAGAAAGLTVLLTPRPEYPRDEAEILRLQAGAAPEAVAALRAIAQGSAHLVVTLEGGGVHTHEVDLTPLGRGELVRRSIEPPQGQGGRVRTVQLAP